LGKTEVKQRPPDSGDLASLAGLTIHKISRYANIIDSWLGEFAARLDR